MQPMLIARAGMNIMESQLLWEFIAFLKARWSARSRVDQRRRRLRQLVAMVRAVAVAGSARNFLAGIRTLLARSAEVDRLTDAVEELERLAGPGGDLDMFVKVLRLDRPSRGATDMEVDGGAGDRREEGEGSNSSSSNRAGSGSGPATGAKRKRAGAGASSSSGGSGDGGSSAPHGQVDNTAHQQPKRRRALAWMRPHQWLPAGFGGLFATTRDTPPPPPPPPVMSRSQRARAVAMAMSRVRRRIGNPTRRRQHQYHQQQQILGQRLSRISL